MRVCRTESQTWQYAGACEGHGSESSVIRRSAYIEQRAALGTAVRCCAGCADMGADSLALLSLNHISRVVRDLEASTKFYTEVRHWRFGCSAVFGAPRLATGAGSGRPSKVVPRVRRSWASSR